jgi:hypothetical protein
LQEDKNIIIRPVKSTLLIKLFIFIIVLGLITI